jgi:hypothetical protein
VNTRNVNYWNSFWCGCRDIWWLVAMKFWANKLGSLHPIIWPEPACGNSVRVPGWAIPKWVAREHQKHWQSIAGQKYWKRFLNEPSAKRLSDIQKFNRV